MWDSIKRAFKGGSKEPDPKFPWIDADQNPWKVPVLDVRAHTTTVISASSDPQCAQNAISYGRDDGTGFIDERPAFDRKIPASLSYRRDRLLADGALFIPQQMEHKWAIYHHRGRILFIRSWQRKVFVAADVSQQGDRVLVTGIHGSFQGEEGEDPALTTRILEFLIWSHAVGVPFPAPLPPGLEAVPQAAAHWCFTAFGNLAHFATPHPVSEGKPDVPLRSHSLLHIAVARGDQEAVRFHLGWGVPVDLLAADGLAPLHWSLAGEDTSMMEFLIARGSPVDVRSAEGATALMTASQGSETTHFDWLLAHGADPNAVDHRGFTALHRAAEMGKREIVEKLLAAGADPRIEAQGHTALSLAEARGHQDIARLLRR